MRRREFIGLLGGAAASWSPAARAQHVRRIGVLMGLNEGEPEGRARISAFYEGLRTLGWIDSRNIQIDVRWTGGSTDRNLADTADLVRLAPDVIIANGTPLVDTVHKATQSIPVVFVLSNDPVGLGHVASIARPGGNITGFTFMELSLISKWVGILKQMAPAVTRTSLLFDPETTPYYLPYLRSIESSPSTLPLELKGAPVRNVSELEGLIESIAQVGNGSLISPAGPLNIVHTRMIAQLAEKFRLPAISIYSQFATDGGLMAYGPDSRDVFRRSAQYVDRILRGESPADLPVQAPTKYSFSVNLKTAKALNLTAPPALLALADEVIE
jgi:putative ABC transport system substrate-binding protein